MGHAEARRTEGAQPTDFVGYGMASKPITGVNQKALWEAMVYAMSDPDQCGLEVDRVRVRNMAGRMQRTMRVLGKPGSPTRTENIRVIKSVQEVTYRTVVNNVESKKERVFALRTDPLRFEMFLRSSKDGMTLNWQAPRSFWAPVFDATAAAALQITEHGAPAKTVAKFANFPTIDVPEPASSECKQQ